MPIRLDTGTPPGAGAPSFDREHARAREDRWMLEIERAMWAVAPGGEGRQSGAPEGGPSYAPHSEGIAAQPAKPSPRRDWHASQAAPAKLDAAHAAQRGEAVPRRPDANERRVAHAQAERSSPATNRILARTVVADNPPQARPHIGDGADIAVATGASFQASGAAASSVMVRQGNTATEVVAAPIRAQATAGDDASPSPAMEDAVTAEVAVHGKHERHGARVAGAATVAGAELANLPGGGGPAFIQRETPGPVDAPSGAARLAAAAARTALAPAHASFAIAPPTVPTAQAGIASAGYAVPDSAIPDEQSVMPEAEVPATSGAEPDATERTHYGARNLHIFADEHGVRAWIRDAALSARQARAVAESVVAELLRQGAVVSSVTVNGRPVGERGERGMHDDGFGETAAQERPQHDFIILSPAGGTSA